MSIGRFVTGDPRRFPWPLPAAVVIACSSLGLGACSSQQAYGAAQAWQRNECFKINDAQERSRCLASTSTSYEDYKRQADAARKPP
jgi:hypothetical protein